MGAFLLPHQNKRRWARRGGDLWWCGQGLVTSTRETRPAAEGLAVQGSAEGNSTTRGHWSLWTEGKQQRAFLKPEASLLGKRKLPEDLFLTRTEDRQEVNAASCSDKHMLDWMRSVGNTCHNQQGWGPRTLSSSALSWNLPLLLVLSNSDQRKLIRKLSSCTSLLNTVRSKDKTLPSTAAAQRHELGKWLESLEESSFPKFLTCIPSTLRRGIHVSRESYVLPHGQIQEHKNAYQSIFYSKNWTILAWS